MSAIYGTVVKIDMNVDVEKQDKTGSYKAYRFTYQDDKGEIKSFPKAMASLRFTPSVEEALKTLKPGDEFTLVQEKNKAGYLDVKSLTKGKLEASELPAPSRPDMSTTVSQVPGKTGRVIGSTYETPEERKTKQRLIVRQAAINQALELVKMQPETLQDLGEVLANAEKFETWVYRGME